MKKTKSYDDVIIGGGVTGNANFYVLKKNTNFENNAIT